MHLLTELNLPSNLQVALADRQKNPGCRVAAMFDLTGAGLANLDFGGLRLVLVRRGMHASDYAAA